MCSQPDMRQERGPAGDPSSPANGDERKRLIYDGMSPKRRRFVDRIGYAAWDPFQEPKMPLDMQRDNGNDAAGELLRRFLQETRPDDAEAPDSAYRASALACAVGLTRQDDHYRAIYDFCIWRHNSLARNTEEKHGA